MATLIDIDVHMTALNKVSPSEPAPIPQEVQVQVHLRKIPLLAALNEDDMRRVNTEIRIRHFNKREVVLHKGGSGDALLFLLSGQLQVVDITEDGRAIGLRILAPGDFFGEIALINDSTRSARTSRCSWKDASCATTRTFRFSSTPTASCS